MLHQKPLVRVKGHVDILKSFNVFFLFSPYTIICRMSRDFGNLCGLYYHNKSYSEQSLPEGDPVFFGEFLETRVEVLQ